MIRHNHALHVSKSSHQSPTRSEVTRRTLMVILGGLIIRWDRSKKVSQSVVMLKNKAKAPRQWFVSERQKFIHSITTADLLEIANGTPPLLHSNTRIARPTSGSASSTVSRRYSSGGPSQVAQHSPCEDREDCHSPSLGHILRGEVCVHFPTISCSLRSSLGDMRVGSILVKSL